MGVCASCCSGEYQAASAMTLVVVHDDKLHKSGHSHDNENHDTKKVMDDGAGDFINGIINDDVDDVGSSNHDNPGGLPVTFVVVHS